MCSFFFWGVSAFALSGLLNDFFALIAIVLVVLVIGYLVRGVF